jgi:hypothetical protein
MKTFAASASWFLGGWVLYDIAAFAIGMPRQATPFVAIAVALAVWLALRFGQSVGSAIASQTPNSRSDLQKAA